MNATCDGCAVALIRGQRHAAGCTVGTGKVKASEMRTTPARSSYQPRRWEGVAGVVHVLMHGRAMCRGRGLKLPKLVAREDEGTIKPGHHWVSYAEGLHGQNAVPPELRCDACWQAFALWWERSDEGDGERAYLQEWHREHGLPVNPGAVLEAVDAAVPVLTYPLSVLDELQVCRVCGCTEIDCAQCIAKTGAPCWWIQFDLCSACPDVPAAFETIPLPEGTAPVRYLGIDPGLANLGIFVLGLSRTSVRCLHRETFKTSPDHGTDEQRLRLIARRLDELVSYWRPAGIGYEDLRSITTGKEQKGTGHSDSGPLLMVCGMLIEIAWRRGDVPCFKVANQSARVAVLGKGKTRGSSKASVRERLQQITGTKKLTLDQADAGAIAFGAFVKHQQGATPPRKKKRK